MWHLNLVTFLLGGEGQHNNSAYIISIFPWCFIKYVLGNICVSVKMEFLQWTYATIVINQIFSAVDGIIVTVVSKKISKYQQFLLNVVINYSVR